MIQSSLSRRVLLASALGSLPGAAMKARHEPGAAPVLGCYVGNPNGNDPEEMFTFEASFDRFSRTLGSAPLFMNGFTDFHKDWKDWVPNAEWAAWSWSKSSRARDVIPVIGLPMATNADWAHQPAIDTFNRIASGQHDDVWRGVIAAWRNQGFRTLYLRPGYEMNGAFMPWFMGTDASSVAAWKSAFRRIAMVTRQVSEVSVRIVWNPTCINRTAVDVASSYPGDDVVDVIGTDIYSPLYPLDLYDFEGHTVQPNQVAWQAKPANRIHFWDYPSATRQAPQGLPGVGWGLVRHLTFAASRGKPVGICETGVGVNPSLKDRGIDDDGVFPTYLADRLFAPGAPPILFVLIWDVDVGDGDHQFSGGKKPQAAAAFRAAFGSRGIPIH
jgi:Glycosyl hydrolase family 26